MSDGHFEDAWEAAPDVERVAEWLHGWWATWVWPPRRVVPWGDLPADLQDNYKDDARDLIDTLTDTREDG